MNILHISSAGTWRGGERQIQYLMEGLSKNGDTNFLMTPSVSILGFRSSQIVARRVAFKKGIFSSFQNVLALISFCKSNHIDLIHGHDSHAHTLLWLSYMFGGLKTKSLITRRLLNPIKIRSVGKYNYPKIEFIICISNAVKKVLIPNIKDQERLVVIHSSIDTKALSSEQHLVKKDGEFVIGYVAAFTEEKDHATFFGVARTLLEKYPSMAFKFLLVGDGPLIEKYKKDSQRIGGNFHFTGFVEEVNQAYLEMDLLLHTSKSEALGTAILDAMKYGLPVVASEVGGIPEIVRHGQNGFLYEKGQYEEMADAIYKIATNKELYNTFSENSKLSLSPFDISAMVEKTTELYQRVNET